MVNDSLGAFEAGAGGWHGRRHGRSAPQNLLLDLSRRLDESLEES